MESVVSNAWYFDPLAKIIIDKTLKLQAKINLCFLRLLLSDCVFLSATVAKTNNIHRYCSSYQNFHKTSSFSLSEIISCNVTANIVWKIQWSQGSNFIKFSMSILMLLIIRNVPS